jgi:hypothetical protein
MSLKSKIGKLVKVDYYKWDFRHNRYLEAIGVIQKVAKVTGTNKCAFLVRYFHRVDYKVKESWFYTNDCKILEHEEMNYNYTWHQKVRGDLQYRPANF